LRDSRKICLQWLKSYTNTKAKREAQPKKEEQKKGTGYTILNLLLHMLLEEPIDQFDLHHWH
jgi:hypothetical protein